MTPIENISRSRKTSMVLFTICLTVMAIRCCYSENVSIASLSIAGSFYDRFYSLCFSGILIFVFLFWLGSKILAKQLPFRAGPLEIGTGIFAIATIISTIAASDKSAAIIDSITILSPMLMAIVLTDALDSTARRKILLLTIAAMAAANTYQASSQLLDENKIMIEEYERAPTVQLEKLGIEPGSFQQMLYEHRLHSKDVRGFFTTGNTAGGFIFLGLFGAIAALGSCFDKSKIKEHLREILVATAIIITIFAGLIMTHSKGAIFSMIAAGLGYLTWLRFSNTIKKHRRPLLVIGVISFGLGILAVINFGITHQTLPGGNSMMVRWQYWVATAKIISQNWLTGVGGGNFASHYMLHKIPAALETVRDPHCFVLSIFSQFGVVGIIGFMAAFILPIGAVLLNKNQTCPQMNDDSIVKNAKTVGIAVVLAMILIRPILIKAPIYGPIEVIVYIIGILYLAPTFIFAVVLWLGSAGQQKLDSPPIKTAPLICGVAAFGLHNLIDFAIFEPGPLTAVWAIIACIIATGRGEKKIAPKTIPLSHRGKVVTVSVLIAIAISFIYFVLTPAATTAYRVEKAKILFQYGRINEATAIVQKAIESDPLNPKPAEIKGKLLFGLLTMGPGNNRDEILNQIQTSMETAIQRDPANFKNYAKLAETYEFASQLNTHERLLWEEKSRKALNQAVALYPGNAELQIKLGKVNEELNDKSAALTAYKKAIQIEADYSEQFKIMYPGKEVFSRLGKIKYKLAIERIEELEK